LLIVAITLNILLQYKNYICNLTHLLSIENSACTNVNNNVADLYQHVTNFILIEIRFLCVKIKSFYFF